MLGFLLILAACSSEPVRVADIEIIAPLYPDSYSPNLEAASVALPPPELLALNEEMRDFVDRYVSSTRHPRQKLNALHSALRSSALLDMDYSSVADGTAAEVFSRGTANCLSYAHLFVAMARYAGLDANYHLLNLRPEWSRHGTHVALRQHVNVLVRLNSRQRYMVDIDPVSRAKVSSKRIISDLEALSLHHNNLAMAHLFKDDLEPAYQHSVNALRYSPDTDFLWINLGAIYSRAGNDAASQRAYEAALKLSPESPSAMNNLMVLHTRRGESEQANFWEQQILKHRDRNPYYHAYLGDSAEQAGDLEAATGHFLAAIKRKQDDAELYYRLGLLHLEQGQPTLAAEYLRQAVANAQLVTERKTYQALLDRMAEPTVARLL